MDYLNIQERDSNRISPVALSIGLFIATVLLSQKFHPWLNLAIFLICLPLSFFSRLSHKTWLKLIIIQLFFAISIFLTGYFYAADTFTYIENMAFPPNIWKGIQLATRALAFSGLGIFYTSKIEAQDLMESAIQKTHLKRNYAYGVLAAWGIFPKIQQEHQFVQQTLKARGINVKPYSRIVIKLMLITAIRWSEHLALALISRGLNEDSPMTHWKLFRWRIKDILFIILFPLFIQVLLLFWPI